MNKSLFEIFKVFFIIGIQLLGGGYVIVPLLKKYIVDERQWMSDEELVDFYAMNQCIPGIIAANIATSAGYRIRKVRGAIAAALGIILPAFFIILLFAVLMTGISEYKIVQAAFKGIRISVIVLIIITVKDLWKKSVNSFFSYVLFFVILTALLLSDISPSLIIIASALLALLYSKLRGPDNA
ncbi:MAG: chromate transporter [Candidatus Avigastranaerophilus sp.]